jgi:arsenate reductase (thioredoxin)
LMTENQTVKPRVIFVCVSNSARSQMAEAFLRSYAGDRFEAYSAGTDPKDIHPLTMKVMNEIGIDMSAHRSKSLRDYMGRVHFGYVVTVCSEADENCPTTFPGVGKRLQWDFEDPAKAVGSEQERTNRFREIRDQIKRRVEDWVNSLG